MMLIIRASLLSSYGKNVVKPRYETKDSQFARKISHVSEFSFWPCCLVLSIIVTFWSFYGEVLADPYYCPQDGQFAKHCQTPVNHRFQLDLWCLPSERHFEAVTVKLSLNAITTKKIADFQNSFTHLLIIAFISLFGALHYSHILELLRWNSRWTLLLPKR